MGVPYEEATSGAKARDEIVKLLRRFGCESVGFMDNFEEGELILAFNHRGRNVTLKASAKGWAAMYLKEHPYHANHRNRGLSEADHKRKALAQGLVAINSVLRDWVKGQVTAVECGILQFEHVFMPYMLAKDGRMVIEHIAESGMLPPPKDPRLAPPDGSAAP